MKKYFAELIGTFTLVLFGCGSAAIAGSVIGTVGIALAFGLSIVCMAYAIGNVSGCHINPAVSLGCLLTGRMTLKDFVGYVIAQVIGAIIASAVLAFIIGQAGGDYHVIGLGANGYGEASQIGIGAAGAFVTEVILTCVFVLTILGVTASESTSSVAGLVIGLTLTFVHIFGIVITGTSVNPARSLAPALLLGGTALSQVWLFIIAPLAGAVIAAFIYIALNQDN